MRAFRICQWDGALKAEQVPDPQAGAEEVLVKVDACGIGLTVLNCIRGDLGRDPANLPRIPGHELVGTVVGVGAGVTSARIGDRCTTYFYLFCGQCERCLSATEPLCERLGGFVGVDRDGGYAELVALPARNAIRLADRHDPVLATTIPDAIATPVHVASRGQIRAGERVAVIAAAGGVGVHMVQVARVYGGTVVGLEAGEAKLRYLEDELGVDAVDSSSFAAARLPAAWHGKADVIVDLLGSADSLRWSLQSLDANGRLVVLTTFRDTTVQLHPRDLVFGQGAVIGSRYATRSEVLLAARLVEEERVRPIVTERVATEAGLRRIHDELRTGQLIGRGAFVPGMPGD